MRMYDIIEKKRDKKELTKLEIEYFINEYSKDNIPDYQASALIMAIYLNGLSSEELVNLTFAMANSSKTLDLSDLRAKVGKIVDKHSTGGVGDKITLIVLPIVAALGIECFKMSGRGLGFTGGTADKIESIEGYNVNLSVEEAKKQVEDIGICLISQSKDIAIADKKIYALRDTTATVESIDLISASIMSKKIACGADKLVLDVTVGNGAFAKTEEDARKLAATMVKIGKLANLETCAVITSMNEPLGKMVGNALEIKEVIEFLNQNEFEYESDLHKDLKEIVEAMASFMIRMKDKGINFDVCKEKIKKAITSKVAYNKFLELIKAQGGMTKGVRFSKDGTIIEYPVLKDSVKYLKEIKAERTGCITDINSKKIGEALVCLGGGRLKKEDTIDFGVGFEFVKKVGAYVTEGDTIVKVFYNDREKFEEAFSYISDGIIIQDIDEKIGNALANKPHVLDVIGENDKL